MSLLKGIVFVSCVLLLSVQCARNIDDFSADMSQMFVFVPTSGSVPQSTDDYTSGVSTSALIGGERDVELYVSEAGSNDIISVEVDSEVFSCSNSVNGRGYALLQYDGSDESLELVPNGLGSIDLTANGANAFTTAIESDTSGDVTFTVYSGSLDEKCSLKLTFPSANDDYVLAFVDFSGNCDFTKVGAIEVKVNMVSGLDLQMSGISTVKANVANPPPASPSTASSSPDTSLSTASPPSNGNSTVSSGSSPSGLSSFSSSSGAASLVPEALAAFVVLVSLF